MPGINRLNKRTISYKSFKKYLENLDSKKYNRLIDAVGKLNTQIDEKKNLSAEDFTDEKKNELISSYGMALKYINDIIEVIEKSSNPDITIYANLHDFRAIMSKDYAALKNSLKDNKKLNLNDIFEESRAKTIELPTELKNVEKAAGNQSVRYKMNFKTENGKEIPGFFTENKSSFSKKAQNDYMIDLQIDISERYCLNAENLFEGNFHKIATHLVSNCEDIVNLVDTDSSFNECIASGFNKLKSTFVKILEDNKDFGSANYIENINNPKVLFAFTEYMHGMSRPMFEMGNREVLGISKAARINKRNSAMSMVAKMLGCPDIIAHSENMRVNINGGEGEEATVKKGTFMEEVKYDDLNKVSADDVLYKGDYSYIENSEGLVKNIANIQILDYICGNPDRHAANIMYNFKDGKLVSVKGIDNDCCFGSKDPTGKMAFVGLNNLKVIPEDTAKMIMNIDEENFKYMLYGYDIETGEVNNALKRLRALKDKIKESEKVYEYAVEGTLVNGVPKICDDKEMNYLSIPAQLGLTKDEEGKTVSDYRSLFGMVHRRFIEGKGTNIAKENSIKNLDAGFCKLVTKDFCDFSDNILVYSNVKIKDKVIADFLQPAFKVFNNFKTDKAFYNSLYTKEGKKKTLIGVALNENMAKVSEAVNQSLEHFGEIETLYNKGKIKQDIFNDLRDVKNSLEKMQQTFGNINKSIEDFNKASAGKEAVDKSVREKNEKIMIDYNSGRKQEIYRNQLTINFLAYMEPLEENRAFSKYELDEARKKLNENNNPDELPKLENEFNSKKLNNIKCQLEYDAAKALRIVLVSDHNEYDAEKKEKFDFKKDEQFLRGMAAALIRYEMDFADKTGNSEENAEKLANLSALKLKDNDLEKSIKQVMEDKNFKDMIKALSPAAFSVSDIKKLSKGDIQGCFGKFAGSFLAGIAKEKQSGNDVKQKSGNNLGLG